MIRSTAAAQAAKENFLWWALGFPSIGWIVFYMDTITNNSVEVWSPPLTLFAWLSPRSYCCWFCSGDTIRPPTNVGIPSGNARSSANAVAL